MAGAAERGAAERFVRLGLALGRHLDGLVDAYYGPPRWEAEAEAGPPTPLPALVADAARLVADLDGGSDPDLGARRRAWLRAQVVGLHAVGRSLAGEPLSYLDEVEASYGVRPAPVPEDDLHAAHRALDGALPGTGPLRDRVIAWREAHTIPPERLEGAIRTLADDFAERTRRAFGLPDGEHVEWVLETDKPWSGFNYYLGDLRSRVAVNVDLPVLSLSLGHLVAHEAYPGHHTEHCRKEVGLVRRGLQLEESIFLVGTPQCLMAEGLADLAIDALLGTGHEPVLAEILRPLGIRYDTEVVAAVSDAAEALSSVRGNAALLLHDRGGSEDDAVEELETWALLSHDRARKSISFLTHPTWRAYIFCYVAGLPLCRSFVAGDPSRFERLLDEQLVPADLQAS